MYSEQLEQLIKSVIADGVITEKERAVLHKKAAAEGVDEDEIDVYVDGLVSRTISQDPQTTTIDFKHINKSVDDRMEFFYGIKEYEVRNLSNSQIQTIYLNFLKRIDHKDDIIEWGISVIYCFKEEKKRKLCYPSNLILKTENNSFELKKAAGYHYFGRSKLPNGKYIHDFSVFRLDSEMIKMLCDAKQITMSLDLRIKTWEKGTELGNVEFKNIKINRFASYAQVFYRSVIDNNSYPDSIAGDDNATKVAADVVDNNYSYSEAAKKLLKDFLATKKEELGKKIKNLFD